MRRGGDRLLFDCGEGTQRQLLRSIGLVDLEEIFLTHFHADHFLGLPGMLKTFGLRGREAPLTIYGPPGLRALFEVLRPVIGATAFEVELVELEPNEPLERDGYLVAPFPVEHRGGAAYGYVLRRGGPAGALRRGTRARARGCSPGRTSAASSTARRSAWTAGRCCPSEVLGETRRGRKLVLTGDTVPSETTRAMAHGADLLVHEATFATEEADRAAETGHSTARGAAELAAAAEVVMLALTHVSPRYPPDELRAEAREVFEATIVPRDFDRVEIPFPERGTPVHVRARAAGSQSAVPP